MTDRDSDYPTPAGRATLVKFMQWRGEARLYRCDPPMPTDDEGGTTEYVAVSAAIAVFSGPETYIFPADADGEVTDWGELEGSYRGGLDHEEALRGAGYEVVAEVVA